MISDMFSRMIPIEIPKGQEDTFNEVLINNAVKFFLAGGILTLRDWCELGHESQEAFLSARKILIDLEAEPEVEPEHELVASPEKPEVPAQS